MKESTKKFRIGTILVLFAIATNLLMILTNILELIFLIPVFFGASAAFGLGGYMNRIEEKEEDEKE